MDRDEPVTNAGFGKQHRLLKPAQFSAVFAARRAMRGALFALHVSDSGMPEPRLGLVIPKKQAPTAVLRNAIKRQAREVFRRVRHQLPARDFVLRLVVAARTRDPLTWRTEIASLFARHAPRR